MSKYYMNFKEWILNESFKLPFSVIKPIEDFYAECYKQFILKPRTPIQPKILPFDLTGSNYEFLNALNPTIKVIIYNSNPPSHYQEKNSSGYYEGYSTKKIKDGEVQIEGKISLILKNFEAEIHSLVEHEMLHFVQDLIKVYARLKKHQKISLGGLAKKSVTQDLMRRLGVNVQGDKKGGGSVLHHKRPVEYLTNLNSLVNDTYRNYIKSILLDLNVETLEDLRNKKPEIVRAINDREKKRKWLSKYPKKYLEKISEFDAELYKLYLNGLYKDFIDSDYNWELVERLFQANDEIKGIKKEKAAEKKSKKEKTIKKIANADNMTSETFDIGKRLTIRFDDYFDYSNLDDGNSDFVREFLWDLGYQEKEDRNGNSYHTITINYNTIVRTFKKIKEERDKRKEHVERCNIDFFAKALAKKMFDEIRDYYSIGGKKLNLTLEKFLEMFYPPPYENCEMDDDGFFKD